MILYSQVKLDCFLGIGRFKREERAKARCISIINRIC